jgi:hypothetical protein
MWLVELARKSRITFRARSTDPVGRCNAPGSRRTGGFCYSHELRWTTRLEDENARLTDVQARKRTGRVRTRPDGGELRVLCFPADRDELNRYLDSKSLVPQSLRHTQRTWASVELGEKHQEIPVPKTASC